MKLIPYLPKFESPQALSVWLYKVARNRCISQHRRVAILTCAQPVAGRVDAPQPGAAGVVGRSERPIRRPPC